MNALSPRIVKSLQRLGYRGTREDLKTLQTATGLTPTGTVDTRTAHKLRTLVAVKAHQKDLYLAGMKGGAVKQVEARLARLGYDVGAKDGVFDAALGQAVKQFKQAHPALHNAGQYFGSPTRKALAQEVGRRHHAPEHVRVKPLASRKRLDAATTAEVAKPRTDGQVGLGEGDSGRAVRNIEARLKAAGFNPQKADGTFDARTTAAVKDFQRSSKLPITGRVDGATWKALSKSYLYARNDTSPRQALNERSYAVLKTERQLAKLGYHPGKVDGLFDARTRAAVKAFEKKHHLGRDGEVGARELKLMKKDLKGGAGKRAYDVAHGLIGKAATWLQTHGPIAPFMHDGVPQNVNCANFVSACLQKAGLISSGMHDDTVSGLSKKLRNSSRWQHVSLAHAKPGDVCVVNGGGHVVMFAGRDSHGNPLFIGSNNRMNVAGHPQYVSVHGGYSPIEILHYKG
ncbi:MAG: peptidoglycan-binding protein [Myxococcaceae bacterium]|nr:peptidoglycan-binding protein [Myxococcaceae bacterium]